jgi:hypothetical protein
MRPGRRAAHGRPWWEGTGFAWRGTPLCMLQRRLDLRGEPFPARAALEIGARVLETLGAGHDVPPEAGGPVVHGRVSSADVWLTPGAEILLQAHVPALEADGPELVPPDRACGEPPTPASDVFAAAALVVSMLSGRPDRRLGVGSAGPFLQDPAVEASIAAVRDRVGSSLPGRTLVALLCVSMSRSPEDRPDATALAGSLRDVAAHVSGESLELFVARMGALAASEIPTVTQGVAVVPPGASIPRGSRGDGPPPWLRTALVGSGAASLGLCAVVAAGIGWRAWPPGESRAIAPSTAAAQVAVPGATRLEVACGDVVRTGKRSVRITGFPAGPCQVRATVGAEPLVASVTLEPAAEVRCEVDRGTPSGVASGRALRTLAMETASGGLSCAAR